MTLPPADEIRATMDRAGLGALPEADRDSLLQAAVREVERRTGLRLSEGLSQEALNTYEALTNDGQEVVDVWLAEHCPHPEQDSLYLSLLSQSSGNVPLARAEFAQRRWLKLYRPDHQQVVREETDAVCRELTRRSHDILVTLAIEAMRRR